MYLFWSLKKKGRKKERSVLSSSDWQSEHDNTEPFLPSGGKIPRKKTVCLWPSSFWSSHPLPHPNSFLYKLLEGHLWHPGKALSICQIQLLFWSFLWYCFQGWHISFHSYPFFPPFLPVFSPICQLSYTSMTSDLKHFHQCRALSEKLGL